MKCTGTDNGGWDWQKIIKVHRLTRTQVFTSRDNSNVFHFKTLEVELDRAAGLEKVS